MRIVLKRLKDLEIGDKKIPEPRPGFRSLRVRYCAICRTDAKMWNQGHRDLVFPRVLGHELVAQDDSGTAYTVWPGKTCGHCSHCQNGRENLCEDIQIMGFHFDGGFATHLLAPEESLIQLPKDIPLHLGCFAEPVGCSLHALNKLNIGKEERIAIYGGGSVGLIIAFLCVLRGAKPLVIEKSEEKIHRARAFLDETGIPCLKDTTESGFDVVLNACADLTAFAQCVVKLSKDGKFGFFSGLTKNEKLETNLINLIHYREGRLYGSYGLTRKDMRDALPIIRDHAQVFQKLVERIVPAPAVIQLLPEVLSGKPLKYILDLSDWHIYSKANQDISTPARRDKLTTLASFQEPHRSYLAAIQPIGDELRASAQAKIDNKTKPLGSLGKLEDLAVQLCLIQQNLNPRIERKSMFVFAADHGVVEEGVSAYPAEVTAQMVKNFLSGGAAINVLCRHHGIDIRVVDMGVNADFEDHQLLVKKKVRKGTRNFALEQAMRPEEAVQALQNGMDVFVAEHSARPIDVVGLGDMGIGNTTSATAIICAVTGISPAEATGRGTGIDDKALEHKAQVIEKALQFHNPDPLKGFDVLQKVGGYEIAGIAGAVLAAASRRVAVVLDGVISTAGGLIAYLINPDIQGYLISGHRSMEPAQQAALSYMDLEPVIDLHMRLGEGTGAAMAINAAEAAAKIMREMASFDEAGVVSKVFT